jgi:hypothetical protein
MRHTVTIENIDELRKQEGIDDVELHDEIRRLRVGDYVRLTFLTDGKPFTGETLFVRITSIKDSAYRGKLAGDPTLTGLGELHAGSSVSFTADHIHSISREPPRLHGRRT